MAGVLQRVGDKPVTIIGHTDNVGGKVPIWSYLKRAEAVKQYLIGRSIDAAPSKYTAGKVTLILSR
jgi:OOP family OmpA-OmpF porin